jgi:hypothetical protein
MNRYTSTQVIKDSVNRRRFESTIYGPIPVSTTDTYIRISGIERLDKLAYQFYGDQTMWPVIAVSNNIGKGTLLVKAGTILRIPDGDAANRFINTINSSR